jgi:hypothetical protein
MVNGRVRQIVKRMAAGFVQITLVPAVGTVLLEVVILMS